jgi:hypothetical protein
MFRTRYEVNVKAYNELKRFGQFLGDYQPVVSQLTKEAFQVVEVPFADDLRDYPPVPPGSRYKRTFKLKRGWIVRLVDVGDSHQVIVSNPTFYTKWVMGSFDQRRNYQTALHRRNGWRLANNIVVYWFAEYQSELRMRFARYLQGYAIFTVKRRNR